MEKRKKRNYKKAVSAMKQKQTVKQSVIINLQKQKRRASGGKPQPTYRNSPPTIQFYPMPQYTPNPFNQEMFNQKFETLKADILQKLPEKTPEKIPVPLGVFNPYREVPMTAMLNKPSEPIFSTPSFSSFPIKPEETEPEETEPIRRRVRRPNRPKEVIEAEKEEKRLRKVLKEGKSD